MFYTVDVRIVIRRTMIGRAPCICLITLPICPGARWRHSSATSKRACALGAGPTKLLCAMSEREELVMTVRGLPRDEMDPTAMRCRIAAADNGGFDDEPQTRCFGARGI